MLGSYGVCGFIRNYVYFFGRKRRFSYRKGSIMGLHSIQEFKQNKFFRPFKRKISKPIEEEKESPKVFMRDTIGSISKFLRYSTWDSAQEELVKVSLRWDSYTVNQVLKTHPPMEKAWLFFNWTSQLRGFKHDQFTYTTMLDIFGEAGRISSMKYLFKQMKEKRMKLDAVTYTSLLRWIAKDGNVEESIEIWEEMKAQGCCPTVVSYTAFMKVLFENKRSKEATEVYKEMLQSGCVPNCYTYTVLMEYLAEAGKFDAALEILSKMQDAGEQPDKAACNMLIEKCARAGETWAMAHILRYMKDNSIVLRYPIYKEALGMLRKAGESDHFLREVNPHFPFEATNEDSPTSKATTEDVLSVIDRGIVLNLLAKRNYIAVDHMLNGDIYKNAELDSQLISAIIQANCANCRPSGAMLAFTYSLRMGLQIEKAAYLSLLGYFIRTNSPSRVIEIVEEMVKSQVSLGTYHASLLLNQLGSARMSTSAERIFNSLPNDQKNLVTYTALMGAYFHSGDADKGLETFNIMERNNIHSSMGTYKVLIVGLQKADRVDQAETYRKERKILQSNGQFRENVSMEQCLCDLLFGGDDPVQATGRCRTASDSICVCQNGHMDIDCSTLQQIWIQKCAKDGDNRLRVCHLECRSYNAACGACLDCSNQTLFSRGR